MGGAPPCPSGPNLPRNSWGVALAPSPPRPVGKREGVLLPAMGVPPAPMSGKGRGVCCVLGPGDPPPGEAMVTEKGVGRGMGVKPLGAGFGILEKGRGTVGKLPVAAMGGGTRGRLRLGLPALLGVPAVQHRHIVGSNYVFGGQDAGWQTVMGGAACQ